MAEADRQKVLKEFIARRHPDYQGLLPHWDFLQQTYDGGRDWFDEHIFRYIKEGEKEFADRQARAYRFNHTREVVDLVDKYLFKMEILRNEKEAPSSVKEYWKRATLNDVSITDFMKRVSNRASVFGRVWIVTDSNKSEEIRTVKEEKESESRVYSYIVTPQHVLDMSYDEQGKLNWILIHEVARDDADPIYSTGNLKDRYRLWTRNESILFVVKKVGNKITIEEMPPRTHGLGIVPVIAADNVITDELYASPAMIADVAYLDRAIANYLSNLDAIIQDQTFSQLVMPAQGIEPGTKEMDKLVEMGTKRIFTYNAEAGEPKYISPDVKQAELILKVINKIINEIYHSVGLAGERTKEDNALGIDNSSGVAKAYDFERVNSLLAAKADSLQVIETRLTMIVAQYHSEAAKVEAIEKGLVHYPDNFDVRGLYDEFEIAGRLALIEAPDEVRREQMNALIEKLFPQLTAKLKDAMKKELKSWPPKLVLDEPGSGGPNAIKKAGSNSTANSLVKA